MTSPYMNLLTMSMASGTLDAPRILRLNVKDFILTSLEHVYFYFGDIFARVISLSYVEDIGQFLYWILIISPTPFQLEQMPKQMEKEKSVASFEYELFDGDPHDLRTVVAAPTPPGPWIDPSSLKLKYKIGRGEFGDVWLATHHQSSDDYDEYHELAVKVLHPLNEDQSRNFLDKFEKIYFKCQGFHGVGLLHGISIVDEKVCIAMKFYEGSVGDRVAQLKGNKLHLFDVLRYGIQLARGILELHSAGFLVMNLKPSNFLLDEHDQVVLGDFGVPYLLLGIPLSSPERIFRLGTPNYMAPEQWEPEIRGPLSFETDAWGFGCCIVEMLTGIQPWFGKSIEDIYHSVVIKQEKPHIPNDLPPAIQNVIKGCFDYDIRNRPLMTDILHVFESCQTAGNNDGEYLGIGSNGLVERSGSDGYTTWYLSKDYLQVGDMVRSRKPLNGRKPQTVHITGGTVVGLESDSDRDGYALVKIPSVRNPVRVAMSAVQRVTSGFAAGDWVALVEESSKHSSTGIIHSVQHDGSVAVGFVGLETIWRGNLSQLQVTNSYYVGQFVRLKANVLVPRFKWPHKTGAWATGRIKQVLPNGCLLVGFPGLLLGDESKNFLADPAEVEKVAFDTCPGLVDKYQHIEDFHWTVRPLVIAIGLFAAMKFSLFVGQNVRAKLQKGWKNSMQLDGSNSDGQAGSNAGWLPPPVANILFKEGVSPGTAR